jgi:hypothetical protein
MSQPQIDPIKSNELAPKVRSRLDFDNLPPNYPKKDDPDEAQRILAWQMSNAAFKSLRTPIIDPKAQLPVAPIIDNKSVPAILIDDQNLGLGKKMDTYGQLILLLAILIPFVPPF